MTFNKSNEFGFVIVFNLETDYKPFVIQQNANTFEFSLILCPHKNSDALYPKLKIELDLIQQKTAINFQCLQLSAAHGDDLEQLLKKAQSDLLIFVDYEMSSPFKDILLLAEEAKYCSPHSLLWGDRGHRKSRTLAPRSVSKTEVLLNTFATEDLKLKVYDATSHLFACRKGVLVDCLEQNYFRSSLNGFETNNLIWPLRLAHTVQNLGYAIYSLPIHWTPTRRGPFQTRIWSHLKVHFQLIKWRGDLANQRRS